MRNLPPDNPTLPMNDGLSYENLQEDFEMEAYNGLQSVRHLTESVLQLTSSVEANLRAAQKLNFINHEKEKNGMEKDLDLMEKDIDLMEKDIDLIVDKKVKERMGKVNIMLTKLGSQIMESLNILVELSRRKTLSTKDLTTLNKVLQLKWDSWDFIADIKKEVGKELATVIKKKSVKISKSKEK